IELLKELLDLLQDMVVMLLSLLEADRPEEEEED
ncbi:RYR3 isoform 21, partial [Pan troglodytes]